MTCIGKTGRVILLFLFVLLTMITGCNFSPGGKVIEQIDAEYAESEEEADDLVMEDVPIEEDLIWVHVCGQVKNPGVYSFPEGSRVFDAVESAGGFTQEADRDSVNLAMSLSDEGKIYISSKEEKEKSANQGNDQSDGKININTATLEQFMSLPGIGEKRAQAILNLRNEKGSFQTVEDLLEAEGIKEGIFNQIKEFLKV